MKTAAAPGQDGRVWSDVLSYLRAHHAAVCRQWFEELRPLGLASGQFAVRAQSTVHRDYLQRSALEPFNDALRSVTGRLMTVRFLGPGDPEAPPSSGHSGLPPPLATANPATPDAPVRRDALVINPENTFDNFVIGPSNRLAHAAAMAVAEKPGRTYNPLFIWGGVGLGKSHLLQAVCLKIVQQRPQAVLYYVSCDGFMTQFFEAVQGGHMPEFRHKFRDVDVLVIDDIHFLAKKDQSQEEFFHTFNTLYGENKQVIVSSDAPPQDIPHLEARLISRFKQGMVAEVQAPDFETRVAIVRQKAAMRYKLDMPEDVAAYIASQHDTNIRELEGAITRLQIQSALDRRPVDLAMARSVFGPALNKIVAEPSITIIIKAVVDFFGVRLIDLQSKRRHRSITNPRQVAMYLARRLTKLSLEEIGGHFGGRDHTTVMHAIETVDRRRKESGEFDQQVGGLEDRVRDVVGRA